MFLSPRFHLSYTSTRHRCTVHHCHLLVLGAPYAVRPSFGRFNKPSTAPNKRTHCFPACARTTPVARRPPPPPRLSQNVLLAGTVPAGRIGRPPKAQVMEVAAVAGAIRSSESARSTWSRWCPGERRTLKSGCRSTQRAICGCPCTTTRSGPRLRLVTR